MVLKNKTSDNVSFIIPVINNFKYTKHLYENIKLYYPQDEIVISDGGSNDETLEYFKNLRDSQLIFLDNGPLNLCENYNRGIENSTKDIIILLHNDMFIPPNFKTKILLNLTPHNIVSYSRIEPPVFPNEEPGKIVRDFGRGLEDLNKEEIIKFSKEYNLKYDGGRYLFVACYKKNWIKLDEITFNPPQMWAGDDDLHLRFKIGGFPLIISDALVYHFVSKTSRQGDYRNVELHSNKNFIRKWGFRHSRYNVKYDIGFEVQNCNSELLEILEPWCNHMLIDDEMQVLTTHYIDKYQKNTSINLSNKIKSTPFSTPLQNNIIIQINKHTFTNNDFEIIQNISDILKDSGDIGKFQVGNLIVKIQSLDEYQNYLVKF
jgi:glycosyltransferase involved in cell wall biosynthesis